MKSTPSPRNQEQDQEVIELLKGLELHKVEYPPELLAARRAAFVVQVKQYDSEWVEEELSAEDDLLQRLEDVKSIRAEYPAELLSARRTAFLAHVQQHSQAEVVEVKEELTSKDQEIIRLFKSIKSAEARVSSGDDGCQAGRFPAPDRVGWRQQPARSTAYFPAKPVPPQDQAIIHAGDERAAYIAGNRCFDGSDVCRGLVGEW